MEFRNFSQVMRIFHEVDHDLIYAWDEKRLRLKVQLADLPGLVAAYKNRKQEPDPDNPGLIHENRAAEIRLAIACESIANTLYSITELAAQVGNRLSNGALPSTFNKLRDKLEKDESKAGLRTTLGDLQCYKKVRELRTEWTHHSSIFVGSTEGDQPLLVAHALRRPSEKKEFAGKAQFSVEEFQEWVERALATMDKFADYLLKAYVIPKLQNQLDESFTTMKIGPNGYPIMNPDSTFEVEQTTVREYLHRFG